MKTEIVNAIIRMYNLLKDKRSSRFMRNRVRFRIAKMRQDNNGLTHLQKKAIKVFFKPYGKVCNDFHNFYCIATGNYSEKYIPDNFHYCYIDCFFNDWQKAKIIDNKTFYHIIFSNLAQPSMIAYRQGGYWYDASNNIIDLNLLFKLLDSEKDFFVKKAENSYGGHGVIYIKIGSNENQRLKRIFKEWKTDIIIQKGINQNEITAKINPSSVNTIRIMTFLRNEGSVKIVSAILRMGRNGAKVDNASSGGITCGILPNGQLKKWAYSVNGEKFEAHPDTNVKFDQIIVPNFKKAIDMVSSKAKQMPHFRLISWDIAIDKSENPVLIEANLRDGEIDFHQLNNGPLFGDETEAILDEVFGKK